MCVILYRMCRDGVGDISWDLKNINLWESVLDVSMATAHVVDPSTDLAIAFGQQKASDAAESAGGEGAPAKAPSSKKQIVPDAGAILKEIRGDIDCYHWYLGSSWVPKLVIPVDNYVTR